MPKCAPIFCAHAERAAWQDQQLFIVRFLICRIGISADKMNDFYQKERT